MKLKKEQINGLKKILNDLQDIGRSDTCPGLSLNCINERFIVCGKIFPSLLWRKNKWGEDKGNYYCPCNAIEKEILSLNYVIKKVKKIIKEGRL